MGRTGSNWGVGGGGPSRHGNRVLVPAAPLGMAADGRASDGGHPTGQGALNGTAGFFFKKKLFGSGR